MSKESPMLMNATPISQLPSPPSSMVDTSDMKISEGTSYIDLIKNLDINKMSAQNSTPTPSLPPPVFRSGNQDLQPQIKPTTQMQMQMPVNPSAQNNVMQQLQNQASVYSGGMPQSSPISEYLPQDPSDVHSGPLKSDLLPDPMFFQNPPPPRKIKKVYVDKTPKKKTILGFDAGKIKNAVLVSAIVFMLISYVAPLLAKNLQWTVNAETGKFTAYGLIVISVLTGGIWLGITEIINRFGTGMV
ncbi:hypothetical protein PBCVNEJV1_524L [Paramecium bursaria Chlorella virus NE-JV-1]|nr:hypothetical protein PBCVNEJV1_524L [Paramecium bursaria Chlorella virus NE-JV-1]